MNEEPKVEVHRGGHGRQHAWPTPTAVIAHHGCLVALCFAEGDLSGEGPVQKLELLPDTETLEPRVLRRFAPQAELYLAYARSAMRLMSSPLEEGDPEADLKHRYDDIHGAADALRQVAGPGRGLSDAFYRIIARHYTALIDGGEPYPVKALGESHHVTISAASRWLKEARRRGYIDDAKEGD